jgi:hypothetical protein
MGGKMSIQPKPVINKWYKDYEDGQLFEVVALDDTDETIEIQYFDGSLEEIDYDTWDEMQLTTAAPPEDWSGPFDDLEADDLADPDFPSQDTDFGEFIDELEY